MSLMSWQVRATMSLVCLSALGLESINLERVSRAQPWRNVRKSHIGACVEGPGMYAPTNSWRLISQHGILVHGQEFAGVLDYAHASCASCTTVAGLLNSKSSTLYLRS